MFVVVSDVLRYVLGMDGEAERVSGIPLTYRAPVSDAAVVMRPLVDDGQDEDVRAVLDDPSPAERARRFRTLVDKYPASAEVPLRLAIAAAEAGLDHDAMAALERSLARTRDLDERQANRLREAAHLIKLRELRIRALDAITCAKSDCTLAVRDLVEELAGRGRADDVREARALSARPGVWPTLTLGTQEQLVPNGTAIANADVPRFAHGELTIERVIACGPDIALYEARRADGERVLALTRLGLEPARQLEIARAILAHATRHPSIARPVGLARAIGGAVFELLAPVRGMPWAALYPRPTRDHEQMLDRAWLVASTLAVIGDTGVTLGFGPYEVFVDDGNPTAPVTFLPSAYMACRTGGRTAPRTPDPFAERAPVAALERYRDAWSAAALVYYAATATMPPHPWHAEDLVDLPAGPAGAQLVAVLTTFLGPTAGPGKASARDLVVALDEITTVEPRVIGPGDRLGPFTVLDLLSDRGGICKIWRAAHAGADLAVIKALRSEHIASRSVRAALRREATMPPRQSWFPTVLDAAGVDDRAAPWFALQLYHGDNLADALLRGPLDLRSTVQLGCEIATGLEAAHAVGIINGDVKCENVFLERGWMTPSSRARARVLDWGCVQSSAGDLLAIARVQVSPTSAPEMLRGGPFSPKVDVYGLGTVLYHAITGVPATAFSAHPTLDQQPRLAALIEASMAHEPADRPALVEVSKALAAMAYELELPWAARTRIATVIAGISRPPPPRRTPAGQPAITGDSIDENEPPPVISVDPSAVKPPESVPEPPTPTPRPVRWPYYLAAGLLAAAAVIAAVRLMRAPASVCQLGPVRDEASLHAEVSRLIGARCFAEAQRSTMMLDDESYPWVLTPRERDALRDELHAAIAAAERSR